jgi:hypothetical protein
VLPACAASVMMMADKAGIIRLTRVAHVRGLRLARAAEDARLTHEAAMAVLDQAQEALARQEALVDEARGMFAADPACGQAKLWLEYSNALFGTRADTVIEAESETERAAEARAAAVRAVARHQVRTDRIAAHHAGLLRAEHRLAETRAELDAPIARAARP